MNSSERQDRPVAQTVKSSENLASIQTKYTDRSLLVRFANRRFHSAIRSLLSKVSFETALDAGCGEGVVLAQVRSEFPAQHFGMDLDRARLREAQEKSEGFRLIQGDLHQLPFSDDGFDMVICLEVLEHVGHPTRAVQELHRISGRYLLASVPNEPWWRIGNMLRLKYLKDWGNTPEHINHWTVSGFVDLLSPYFEVRVVQTPVLWTFVLAEAK